MPLRQTRELVEQLRKSSTFTQAQLSNYNDAARDVFFQFSIFKCPVCLRFIRKDQFKDHCSACSSKLTHPASLNESGVSGLLLSAVSAYPQVESLRFNSSSNRNDQWFQPKSVQSIELDLESNSFKAKCDAIDRAEMSNANPLGENNIDLKNIPYGTTFVPSQRQQEIVVQNINKDQSKAFKEVKDRKKSPMPQSRNARVAKKDISVSARDLNKSVEPMAAKRRVKIEAHKSPVLIRNHNDANKKPQAFEKLKKSKEDLPSKPQAKQSDLRLSQRAVPGKAKLNNTGTNVRPSEKNIKPVLGQTPNIKPTQTKNPKKPIVTYKIEVSTNFVETRKDSDVKRDRGNSVSSIRVQNSTHAKKHKSPNHVAKILNVPTTTFVSQQGDETGMRDNEKRITANEDKLSSSQKHIGTDLIRIINLNKDDLDSLHPLNNCQVKNQSSSVFLGRSDTGSRSQFEKIDSGSDEMTNYGELRSRYKKNKVTGESRSEYNDCPDVVQSLANTETNFGKIRLNIPLAERTGISERVFAITKGSVQTKLTPESERHIMNTPTTLQTLQAPLEQGFRARSRSRIQQGQSNNQSTYEVRDAIDLNSTLTRVKQSLDELTIENNEWRKASREKRIAKLAVRLQEDQAGPETTPRITKSDRNRFAQNQTTGQNLTLNEPSPNKMRLGSSRNESEIVSHRPNYPQQTIDVGQKEVNRKKTRTETDNKTFTQIHRH